MFVFVCQSFLVVNPLADCAAKIGSFVELSKFRRTKLQKQAQFTE